MRQGAPDVSKLNDAQEMELLHRQVELHAIPQNRCCFWLQFNEFSQSNRRLSLRPALQRIAWEAVSYAA